MKVLHLSTWNTGGAAVAAIRLDHGLKKQGIESSILHMSTKIPAYIDAAIGKFTHSSNPIFHSYNFFGENLLPKIATYNPDILHIHWIGAGFMRPEAISKIGIPIVWTLHDLWPFLGGEHLPDSDRYKSGYYKDNRSKNEKGLDLDKIVWQRKMRVLSNKKITFIAPSTYVLKTAQTTKIIGDNPVIHIPNAIDTLTFYPDIRSKREYILFVANSPQLDINKGYKEFKQSIYLLTPKLREKYDIKVVGGDISNDQDMAEIYNKAVLTVVPSHLENLPYVIMESMACGTPVVAFNVGGIPDLIKHKVNGYLAKPHKIEDLATGMNHILNNNHIQKEWGLAAFRHVSTHYNQSLITKKHIELYRQLISG